MRALALAIALLLVPAARAAPPPPDGLAHILAYPFVTGLIADEGGWHVAWIEVRAGIRTVWVADAPSFAPRRLYRSSGDDGMEITQLRFDPQGANLVWVRGGDHDANWPAEGDAVPDAARTAAEPKVEVWTAPVAGGAARMVVEGDEPTLSRSGHLAYVHDAQIWEATLDGRAKAARLFYDRGKDRAPTWSPDGARLLFVSGRGDHALVGVYADAARPLVFLAPSTGRDDDPVWSPDGARIAFTRQPGSGGAPESLLAYHPRPFSIWSADAATGEGQRVWASPATLDGSYPGVGDGVALRWMAGDTLAFVATLDGWEHLYALPAAGGTPRLLTPGRFMVEHVFSTTDRRGLLYAANTGGAAGDDDRRHLFRVAIAGGAPVALTKGEGVEWSPVAGGGTVVAIAADDGRPMAVARIADGHAQPIAPATDYPTLPPPRLVAFRAADGTPLQGQLFVPNGGGRHPALVFVHGGPSRQMLTGWHYMDFYAHVYAANQYLAAQGFVVLSVNYRLGIGYGRAFEQPAKAGPMGGSEYADVLAAGRWLAAQPNVDAARIGIYGGSYGGYLTAMALSRSSDLFKAGVDFAGVHDWSLDLAEENPPSKRYEQGDREAAMKVAFEASPVAAIDRWRSPVLLIQGDDDRNVRFSETVDLARRLAAAGVPYQELVVPNEIHGFLRYEDQLAVDAATVRFLEAKLKP